MPRTKKTPESDNVEQHVKKTEKKTDKKLKKKIVVDENSDEEEENTLPTTTTKKNVQSADWDKMSDDVSIEEFGKNEDDSEDENHTNQIKSVNDDDSYDGNNTSSNYKFFGRGNNNNTNANNRKTTKPNRFAKSITNFDYSVYNDPDSHVTDLSNQDLVKILIVRTYNDNQYGLCSVMKQVLRAMNLECPLPGTRTAIDQQQPQQYQRQQYTEHQQSQNPVQYTNQYSNSRQHQQPRDNKMQGKPKKSFKKMDPREF